MSLQDGKPPGNKKVLYKLEPPEKGWGYIIVLSMAIMILCTVVPLQSFGIIYGQYLASLKDEASATANINAVFSVAFNFMGLVANHLMKSHSNRFVGLLGSVLYFIGNFLTIFASSLEVMIVTLGALQGIGFGLMFPVILSSFNSYFLQKRTMMLSIALTVAGVGMIMYPVLLTQLKDSFGYRGTVAIVTALSLHGFLAMLTLQPVKWHMVKVPISAEEISFMTFEEEVDEKIKCNEQNNIPSENLPVTARNESYLKKCWITVSNFLELSLLKDARYMNIAVGIALAFPAEFMFLMMLPMFLRHMSYSDENVALIMSVFMGSDVAGRISLAVFSALFKISSRKIFFCGVCLLTILRLVFIIISGPWIPTILVVALLGYLRCLTQVIFPLVLVEYSEVRFPAAFGVYLIISGILNFISGQVASLVALNTTGDIWVQLFLTFQGFLCVISWSIEIICKTNKSL